jgi:hypothetical protein
MMTLLFAGVFVVCVVLVVTHLERRLPPRDQFPEDNE